jgi:hypothetical protein
MKEMMPYVMLNQGNPTATTVSLSLAHVRRQMILIISAVRNSAVCSTKRVAVSPHKEPTLV